METALNTIILILTKIFSSIPFSSATWVVIGVLGFFIWLFAKANNNRKSPVDWEHMLLDPETNRASPYRAGYIVGIIISTWIVIGLFDKDKLTWDIFSGYLTYLLGGAGVIAWMKTKGGENTAGNGVPPTPPLPPVK